MQNKQIAKELLLVFGIAQKLDQDEITDFEMKKSHVYGMQSVLSFRYKGIRYYATDDYSLMDNPKYIQEVLEEFAPNITGRLIKNPVLQSDGAIYAVGINGREYYLWEVSN